MCSLAKKGVPPKDKRARHGNRPHKFTDEVRDSIIQHVSSFRARKSHYSSGQKQYVYLHEDLNVEKMQRLYKDAHPTNKVSLSSYKKVFYNNFNTSLGYPRCDTCSTCNEYIVKCKEIQQELSASENNETKTEFLKKQEELEFQQGIHERKADTF